MRLAELTTLRLGGPARAYVRADTPEAVVAAVRAADAAGEDVLVLGGGSNVVVADEGFRGTVVHVVSRGVEPRGVGAGRADPDAERVALLVQAGEPWDPFVEGCVADGLAGVECLSGIPGSVGATPIQNVGAYGQEVAETISAVRVFDRARDAVMTMAPRDCAFAYRSSVFKRTPGRWVVLAVEFTLTAQPRSLPIRYAELARALGVAVGGTAPLRDVREAVLALRARKGMVLDDPDRDTWSAGSFFTNPILEPAAFASLVARAGERPPSWPEPDGRTKTSAAWLIERAGYGRGYGDPETIAISSKHSLALTNRGGGSAAELRALAQEIARGVEARFGVALEPEPVFVGHAWRPAARSAAPGPSLLDREAAG